MNNLKKTLQGRIKLAPRNRQRMSRRMVYYAASSLVLVLTAGFFIYFQLSRSEKVFASTMTATTGNWSSASTWSSGRVPASNDTLLIPAGVKVTVDVVTVEYQNMKINVYGHLDFNGGKKIRMCDGVVVLNAGGLLTGDNNGSKVEICNNTVWSGPEQLTGPLTISIGGTLPITLLYFKAKLISDYVQFDWATSAEINNDYFTIERSADGKKFDKVLTKPGAGNSTTNLYYSASDGYPLQGYSYYRLKQTDYDGKFSYSDVVTVKNGKKQNAEDALVLKSIYPNPFDDQLKADFILKNSDVIEVQLFSSSGQLVKGDKFVSEDGFNNYELNGLGALPKGVYFLNILHGGEKITQKVIKN